ncbi:MAG: UbiA family prenyltransferase [Elusimicrobia bacterium]|nr:UbiA family prenyltransferase [Elusimicrobiota bacterium]
MAPLVALCKPRISAAAAFSAGAVYVCARGGWSRATVPLVLGVFLLSCGACALNEYRERDIDGLLPRTRGRPLPAGRLSPRTALRLAAVLIGIGLLMLFWGAGTGAAVLGAGAALWYDCVYTRLKRMTAFAAVPGALVGAVLPAIGWVSAGRGLDEPALSALCLFFFLWQAPHFWLLAAGHGNDLQIAGLPNLRSALGAVGSERVISVWMASSGMAAVLLPLFGVTNSAMGAAALLLAAIWLTARAAVLLGAGVCPKRALAEFNAFVVAVTFLVAADPWLPS